MLLSASAQASLSGPGGHAIMVKNEEARKLADVTSAATLTTGGGGNAERVKEFTWWRKLQADAVRYNTLTRFHSPAEVRGEGILFLERANDENDVLMYLPNFKKIRRVETQQQSSSFMGSEFSYADIAAPHVDDFKYRTRADEPCPNEPAVKCHVVEAVPATDSVRERTGYARSVNWIGQDNFMVRKAEYTDLEDKPWKRLEASEIRKVDAKAGKWMAHRIRVESLKTGRFTVLQFADVKVNAGIPDATFTQQNLSRVK